MRMNATRRNSKWLALLICFVMIFTLAACGGDQGSSSKNVTLTLWHWKVAFDPGLKAVADAYKKKTGVTVETQVFTPDAAYQQKTAASSAAGNLPDIYLYWASPAGGAFDGQAMEWSDELAKDKAWKDSFFPAALSGVAIGQANIDTWKKDDKASDWMKARKPGEIFGIPIDVGAFQTIYGNKKLITEAGLPTTAPASIEEWLDDMNKIKAKTGVPGFVFSAKTFTLYENWMANFVDYMKNGPDEFTKFMTREAKMSTPEHMQWATFINDVVKSGNMLPGVSSLDIDPADQAFAQGKAAYDLGGTFTYASITQMGMDPKDIVSFRVPAYKNSKVPDAKVTPFPLVSAIVTDKGPHKKEAVDFVKFLTSEEGMVLYANNAFDIPSVNLQDKSKLNDALNSMLSSLSAESNWYSENAAVVGLVGGPEFQKFHDEMQKMILGQETPEQVAAAFDKMQADEKAKADAAK